LEEIEAVKEMLKLSSLVSGLCVNYTKSTTTFIRCAPEEVEPDVALLACPIVELPIT
jgi:hypothetical protein